MKDHRGRDRGSSGPGRRGGRASIQQSPGKHTVVESQAPVELPARAASSGRAAPGPGATATGMPGDVQARMERAFGLDFSAVRIHHGSHVDAIGALAYTQGTDIHFAPGEYAPRDPRGQALLGHELAHVVQQSSGRVQPTTQAKGLAVNDDAELEREADAAGDQAARGERVTMAGAGSVAGAAHARPAVQAKPAGAAIQMAPKTTHYGTFTDEKYALTGNKIDMTLKFTPNDKVDATKIGLTQSLRSYSAGVNFQIDPTTAARTSQSGHFIDRVSDRNNPIYGSNSLGGGQGLSSTEQTNNPTLNPTELNPDRGRNATFDLGYRHKPGVNWVTKDAGLYDGVVVLPGTNAGKEFETTALAIDGNQAGTYYGSVKWGYKRDGSGNASLIPFERVSMGTPSKDFLGAARAWNAGTARGTLKPKANGTHVYDNGLTSQFTLDTAATVTQRSTVRLQGESYLFVEVTSNPHQGDTGYIKVADLQDQGDGSATVDLPIVAVKVMKSSGPLYGDQFQRKRLQQLPKDTRVKVTSTKGMVSQIEVVDGPDLGKVGWVQSSALQAE